MTRPDGPHLPTPMRKCCSAYTRCARKQLLHGGMLTCRAPAGALGSVLPYGPALCEHCVRTAGLDPGRRPRAEPLGERELNALLGGVRAWEAWLDACETAAPAGFIATRLIGAATDRNWSPSGAARVAASMLVVCTVPGQVWSDGSCCGMCCCISEALLRSRISLSGGMPVPPTGCAGTACATHQLACEPAYSLHAVITVCGRAVPASGRELSTRRTTGVRRHDVRS